MISAPTSPTRLPARQPFVICGECLWIRGTVPSAGGAWQLCDCYRGQPAPDVPLWKGDHGTNVELCRCCGLVLLRSGSRWSVWFCSDCAARVKAFNASLGLYAIPIGRHSIMNPFAGRPSDRRATAEQLVEELVDLGARIDHLDVHRDAIVATNLEALGFARDTDTLLDEYLHAERRSHLSPKAAFEALEHHFARRPG